MRTTVPFGQFLPDAPDLDNPGLIQCDNVLPGPAWYKPFLSGVDTGVTISGEIRGAYRFERKTGDSVQIVATTTDLHHIVGAVVTSSSLAYSLTDDATWNFQEYNDLLVATAPGHDPVYLADKDSDTAFVTLPGSPPEAKFVNRVGEFLMFYNMTDIDASLAPYRARWSPYNNPAGAYVTDIATQSGAVDLGPEFGPITGAAGGRYDIIFQKYAVSRIAYTGGTTAFSKELIEEGRGCIAPPSIAAVGSEVYFLSHDSFCRSNGASVEVLSDNRVFDWFMANVSQADIQKTQASIDWVNRCVIWNFVPTSQTGYGRQIVFSWVTEQWTTASIDADWFFSAFIPGVTLEDLDALYPSGLDSIDASLDSFEFEGLNQAIGSISGGSIFNHTGPPLEAVFESGEFQPQEGKRVFVSSVTPLIENVDASTYVNLGRREDGKGEARVYSAEKQQGPKGFATAKFDGRYMTARVRVPAGANWDNATGFQVQFVVTGET